MCVRVGLYGIAAANAYMKLHPDHKLAVLESGSTVGGVWSHGTSLTADGSVV